MLRYETLMLAVPEITADEAKKVEKQLEDIIQGNKGSVISFERWGKYKLAYPVRKNDYGVYFLMRFEYDKDNIQDLLAQLNDIYAVKQADLIMRNMLVQLEEDDSLEYKRPESLEEAPAKDVDSFLRENQMSGFSKSRDRGSYQRNMPAQELESIDSEEATIQEANEANIQNDEPDLA